MSRAIIPSSFDRWHVVKLASSLAALAVLVAAVPVVLVTVGGVPFAHLGASDVSRSLSSNHVGGARLVSGWIAGCALLLAWLTWTWMTLCVAIELRSWVTGRSPVRLPASRTLQSVAACLVGTALAMSTVGKTVPSSTPSQHTVPGSMILSSQTMGSLRVNGSTVSPGSTMIEGAEVSYRDEVDVVPMARLLGVAGATEDSRESDEPDGSAASEGAASGIQGEDPSTARCRRRGPWPPSLTWSSTRTRCLNGRRPGEIRAGRLAMNRPRPHP